MPKNILITGKPKSGKSTLLKKLITTAQNKVGFITNEILDETGRVGFDIQTHGGDNVTLAHIDFQTPHKVSKYSIDTSNLEKILPLVSRFDSQHILYLDEIGQMQLLSEKFKHLVLSYLDSSNTCIATISSVYTDDFTEAVKARPDVMLIEITPENRETQRKMISELLKK